jgi:hypothetical protein
MKVALAFFLVCAVPVFSQSTPAEPPRCLPTTLGPFPFGGVARPETDEYLYPRYFRYLKEWDKCLAHGKWPASKVEQFPSPYPAGMNDAQRKIVTTEAYDWDVAPREATVKMVAPGSEIEARIRVVNTWVQMQQRMQQRRQDADERDEKAKLVASRLEKLRLRMGKTSFVLLEQHVHQLFHAIPGRLVQQQLPEAAMFARYLGTIAMMDRFAANGGEDGQAAASARDDEQRACGLSDKDEETLRRVADDLQKDTHNDLIDPPPGRAPYRTNLASRGGVATLAASPTDAARFAGLREGIEAHVEQLRLDLGETCFAKVEKRVHAFYESDPVPRVIPVDSTVTQTEAGDKAETPR